MSLMASAHPTMPPGAGGVAPKRPRLSLQTNTPCKMPSQPCSRAFPLNSSDATAFNTLSNAYLTAIERKSTLIESRTSDEPLTATNALQSMSLYSPSGPAKLAVNTPRAAAPSTHSEVSVSHHESLSSRTLTPLPTVVSPTSPMSAPAVQDGKRIVFGFSPQEVTAGKQSLQQVLHAAATMPSSPTTTYPQEESSSSTRPDSRAGPSRRPPLPYKQSNSLRSILRNSPLPPRAASSSPPRSRIMTSAARIRSRAAKRVCYNSPIEQEITTNKYTKPHSDLFVEEFSPRSPLRDLNQRSEAAVAGSPQAVLTEKLKLRGGRGEKKRCWVWTIGREEDADEDEEELGGAVLAAARAATLADAGANLKKTLPPRIMLPWTSQES